MATYEEKFIVINRKHLKKVPLNIREQLEFTLKQVVGYIPKNKYYVVNQDEPYADNIIKFILDHETKKEELCHD